MTRTPRANQTDHGQYTIEFQAGGQHVFEKLHPERFPHCGGGVLPPVLISKLLARATGAIAETAYELRVTAPSAAHPGGRQDKRSRTG